MGRYVIRRILQAIPLLFLLSIFMFTLIHLMPGGPDQVIFNPHLSPASRAALRARFGLDDPVAVQYLKWLRNVLTGDFGFSFGTNLPVTYILGQRFPATLELFGCALTLALVVAIFLGVISAIRQGTITDYILTTLSYFGIAMPIFLFGLIAQYIFGVLLHWFPTSGTATLGYQLDPFDAFVDHIQHLILPMMVLSITFIAGWSRYMRSSMIEVIKQDYMRTARAKGVSPGSLMLRHALRNAIIPLITIVALDFGAVAGGATITEGVFAWPGMGLLFIQSLEIRDYPVLLAMLMIGAIFVISFNLIADILYAVMDPRIRYS
ncbi:MAG TPA: ABC transporter permease [Ktedonobacteraceae bacterium]|jgi:peptide/nickel transport system permease protein|nr:ABC transporter permease [Ktedonobacteraceae bacterium]